MIKKRKRVSFSPKVSAEYRKLLKLGRESFHKVDLEMLRKAFITLCESACLQASDPSEESLIIHSLRLAQTVIKQVGLATRSATAAMLYPAVAGKKIPENELTGKFPEAVVSLVKELVLLYHLPVPNPEKNTDELRKLILTRVNDIRVVLIRIAEIHTLLSNSPTEESEQNKKIRQLALEGMHLYAPIAHRLGLYNLKNEIEDHALRILQPNDYLAIENKLKESAARRNRQIREFIAPIQQQLDEQKFTYEIKSRIKSIFSIYNKMKKQKIDFDEVYDLFAIRIIIDSSLKEEKENCWKVFSIVTNLYQPNPERLRDWITVPKPSTGYEALHITVMDARGHWTEVQIRTRRMDEIAEKGFAAHWKYKGQKSDKEFDAWIDKLREIIDSNLIAFDAIDKLNREKQSNEIFVFTPRNELKRLKKGSTVLDFAYEIHSDLGNTCVGGKVNGRMVSLRYVLNNGDQVEILTRKDQQPRADWLEFVVTTKAQEKIKHALLQQFLQHAENGKEIFKRRLRNWKIPFSDTLVNKLIRMLNMDTSQDLYSAIYENKINLTSLKNIITRLHEEGDEKQLKAAGSGNSPNAYVPKLPHEDLLIIDEDKKDIEYKLAPCCNPVFGDDVFGFVTINEGVKIHRTTCPNAAQLISRYGYRIVKARWAGYDNKAMYATGLNIKGMASSSLHAEVAGMLASDNHIHLQSLHMDSADGTMKGTIRMMVKNRQHLDEIIGKLKKIKGITSVSRIDSFEIPEE